MAHQRNATTTWSRTEEGDLPVSLLKNFKVSLRGSSSSSGDKV